MSNSEHVNAELSRLTDEVTSVSSKLSELSLKINTRLRELRTTLDQDRNLGQVERAEILSAVTRLEEQTQRIEDSGQKVERISPHGLAKRVPRETLEEARRIVKEADAKGEPVSTAAPDFGDEDISGVWVVVTKKSKFKIPNKLVRAALLIFLGIILSYFGITLHDAVHAPTPLVLPATHAAEGTKP